MRPSIDVDASDGGGSDGSPAPIGPVAFGWTELTRRSVELRRRRPAAWALAMDRADALEAAGIEERAAHHQALGDAGA